MLRIFCLLGAVLALVTQLSSVKALVIHDVGPHGTTVDLNDSKAEPYKVDVIEGEGGSAESREKRSYAYGNKYSPLTVMDIRFFLTRAQSYGPFGIGGLQYGRYVQPYGGPSPPRYRRSYPFKPPFFYFH